MKFFLKLFSIIFIFSSIILFLDSFKLIEPITTACETSDTALEDSAEKSHEEQQDDDATDQAAQETSRTTSELGM